MKKILTVVVLLIMVFAFAGCGTKTVVNPTGGKTEPKEKIKGNCKAYDCIKKLEITDTLEEVNKKMGFDGTLTNETYNIYKWEITSDSSIEVTFYSSGKSTIKAEFNKEEVANSKVDLSQLTEMKTMVQKGEMTYSKFKEMVGNVDGVLVEKSSFSNKYLWYNSKTKYVTGTFSLSSDKCTFLIGYNN